MGESFISGDIGTIITSVFVPFIKSLFSTSVLSYIILFSIGLTVVGSLIFAILRR